MFDVPTCRVIWLLCSYLGCLTLPFIQWLLSMVRCLHFHQCLLLLPPWFSYCTVHVFASRSALFLISWDLCDLRSYVVFTAIYCTLSYFAGFGDFLVLPGTYS